MMLTMVSWWGSCSIWWNVVLELLEILSISLWWYLYQQTNWGLIIHPVVPYFTAGKQGIIPLGYVQQRRESFLQKGDLYVLCFVPQRHACHLPGRQYGRKDVHQINAGFNCQDPLCFYPVLCSVICTVIIPFTLICISSKFLATWQSPTHPSSDGSQVFSLKLHLWVLEELYFLRKQP